MAIQLGSAYGKIALDVNAFMAGIKTAKDGIDSLTSKGKSIGGTLSQSFNGLQSSFSSIGNTLTRTFTLPVAAGMGLVTLAGGQAIRVYADFEKQMSGVQAILGATQDEAKKLRDMAIQLGLDPKLIVSTQEVAQVFEELAKNGLTAQQILDGAARSAIALANATGTDFATAAQIASTAMQLFNLQAEDFEAVVNNITGVANTSRFSVEDFAQAMAMGGGVASQMRIPIEDFATAVAGLSNSFASGSDAGTSFKTFLQRLAPDTAPAKKAMEELGIITEEQGNRFFDSEGNMKSLAEIAGILQEAFKGLSDEQRILALTNIFGTDAMRAAGAMAELGADGFNKLAEAMAKTDAAANAATRMNNLAGDVEVLKGVIEGFQINFVDSFGEKLREPIQIFTNILTEHSDEITAILDKLGVVLGDMATSLATSIAENGPSILEFFDKMVEALPELIDKAVQIGEEVAPHLEKLFEAFMNMDPETLALILEVVAALAVLGPVLSGIAGVMSFLVSLGTIISSVVGAIGGLGSVVTAIGAAVTTVGAGIGTAAAAIGTALAPILLILAAIILVIGLLYLAWKTNFLGMGDAINSFVSIVKSLWAALMAFLRGDTDAALGHLREAWETYLQNLFTQQARMQSMLQNIGTMMMNAARAIVNGIKTAFNINWSEITTRIITALVNGLQSGATAVINAARNIALNALNAAKSVLGDGLIPSGSTSNARIARSVLPTTATQNPAFGGSFAGGGAGANRSVGNTIHIYNPSPEAASSSVDRTLSRLSYLGVVK